MLLECPGSCQLVHTMKSPALDHRLDSTIWEFTAAQHFASNENFAASACHISVTRFTAFAAVELLVIGFTQLRRRGRWTSTRTLERCVQEGTFLLHPSQLTKGVADRLRALAELAPGFFAAQDCGESHHQPLQPPL